MWRGLAVLVVASFAIPACSAADDKPQAPTVYKVCGSPELKEGEPCVAAPKLIHDVWPEYTEAARKARIQGRVLLEVGVDKDGVPQVVGVVRSLQPDLDQKAIEAVRQWRFEPATYQGQPVAVKIQVEVTFRLR